MAPTCAQQCTKSGLKFENPIHRKFIHLILFLVTLTLLPFLLIFYTILCLIRSILTIYKNKFRPEYGEFLSQLSSVIAAGDCPYKNTGSNITYYAFTKGHLDLEKVIGVIEESFKNIKSLSTKYGKAGAVPRQNFVELTQELTTWMGFSVWKTEKNFSVQNHVKKFDLIEINKRLQRDQQVVVTPIKVDEVISEEEAANLAHDLIKVPFVAGTSPWEILIHSFSARGKTTNGNLKRRSLLIFRCSHALADGISIMTLLSHFMEDPLVYSKSLAKFTKTIEKPSFNIKSNPITFILSIYDFIGHQLTTWDDNFWHVAENSELRTQRFHIPLQMPIETIKQITLVHGDVKFTTVLLAGLAGSIKRFMTVRHIQVPQSMHVSTVVGQPRDPRWTCNNFGMVEVRLPIGLNDRCQVVAEIEKDYNFLQTSSRVPRAGGALMSFLGALPRKMAPLFAVRATTGLSTNVPAFERKAVLAETEIETIQGVANLPSSIGICLYSFGYGEKLSLLVGVSKDIMGDIESVRQLVGYLKEEFHALLLNHRS